MSREAAGEKHAFGFEMITAEDWPDDLGPKGFSQEPAFGYPGLGKRLFYCDGIFIERPCQCARIREFHESGAISYGFTKAANERPIPVQAGEVYQRGTGVNVVDAYLKLFGHGLKISSIQRSVFSYELFELAMIDFSGA